MFINKETLIIFDFRSHGTIPAIIITAKGFESEHHVEMWAHHKASFLSASRGDQFWCGGWACGDGNFCRLAVPDYYNHNVHIIMESIPKRNGI